MTTTLSPTTTKVDDLEAGDVLHSGTVVMVLRANDVEAEGDRALVVTSVVDAPFIFTTVDQQVDVLGRLDDETIFSLLSTASQSVLARLTQSRNEVNAWLKGETERVVWVAEYLTAKDLGDLLATMDQVVDRYEDGQGAAIEFMPDGGRRVRTVESDGAAS